VTAGYHFSIDDVFDDLVHLDVASPLWSFLDEARAGFGIEADLYAFLEGDLDGHRRSLDEITAHARDALAARPWLRLGPHARDAATPPHAEDAAAQTSTFAALYAAIDRAVGRARRSAWVRLHYFSEPWEAAPQLLAEGVRALLLTDREAIAYRLPDPAKAELAATGHATHAGLALRRSHIRLEEVLARGEPPEPLLDRALARHGYVSVFTHAVEVARPEIRALALRCFAHLAERGVPAIEP
jgi:hypothetical protein